MTKQKTKAELEAENKQLREENATLNRLYNDIQFLSVFNYNDMSKEIKKIKSDIDFNKRIWTEICNQIEKETKIGLWLALAMSFFICLSIVIDWYCK
nr:MAG TPA: hypothetical protein [Caudoviricetes sp.]